MEAGERLFSTARSRFGCRVTFGMSNVFIVGEADDYVEAVFTSRELASAYLDQRRDSDHWWIEEAPLDPSVPPAKDPLRGLGGFNLTP
jgi:hypothetical protein